MFIYSLYRDSSGGYDTYDSCVVVAESEEDAKTIHPNRIDVVSEEINFYSSSSWVRLSEVQCELIGKAMSSMKRGVVCASFNAG